MRYRDHKGGLAESLNTTINVYSKQELLYHLNERYSDFGREISEIKFKHVGMDNRIGWDTYYVLIRLQGQDGFSVAGMSDAGFIADLKHVAIKRYENESLTGFLEPIGNEDTEEIDE